MKLGINRFLKIVFNSIFWRFSFSSVEQFTVTTYVLKVLQEPDPPLTSDQCFMFIHLCLFTPPVCLFTFFQVCELHTDNFSFRGYRDNTLDIYLYGICVHRLILKIST